MDRSPDGSTITLGALEKLVAASRAAAEYRAGYAADPGRQEAMEEIIAEGRRAAARAPGIGNAEEARRSQLILRTSEMAQKAGFKRRKKV